MKITLIPLALLLAVATFLVGCASEPTTTTTTSSTRETARIP